MSDIGWSAGIPPWLQRLEESVTDLSVPVSPSDLRVDIFYVRERGQFAPDRPVGVTITYLPTGASVSCSSERSQWANRQKAFDELLLLIKKSQPTKEVVPDQTLLDACLELAAHVEGRYPQGGRLPDTDAGRQALDKVLRIAIASGLDNMGAM